jgi:hypothetical protein
MTYNLEMIEYLGSDLGKDSKEKVVQVRKCLIVAQERFKHCTDD